MAFYNNMKDKAQKIIDYFFDKGVALSKKDYDVVLGIIEEVKEEKPSVLEQIAMSQACDTCDVHGPCAAHNYEDDTPRRS